MIPHPGPHATTPEGPPLTPSPSTAPSDPPFGTITPTRAAPTDTATQPRNTTSTGTVRPIRAVAPADTATQPRNTTSTGTVRPIRAVAPADAAARPRAISPAGA
ncbi:hypothetical protein ACWEPC_44255, partial [Nonomuraea sp. NPDC004297]